MRRASFVLLVSLALSCESMPATAPSTGGSGGVGPGGSGGSDAPGGSGGGALPCDRLAGDSCVTCEPVYRRVCLLTYQDAVQEPCFHAGTCGDVRVVYKQDPSSGASLACAYDSATGDVVGARETFEGTQACADGMATTRVSGRTFDPCLAQGNDCARVNSQCGDGVCRSRETCEGCEADCGTCGAPVDPAAVRVTLGDPETVFDPVLDGCADLDLPDVQAHALRTRTGIALSSGNAPDSYFLFGPDFDHLARSCGPVLESADDPTAESFTNQEWITSLWTDDGRTVHALVHNEFHDPAASSCKPGDTTPGNPCWYNSIGHAISQDGGRTFVRDHLVAAPPMRWDPSAPRGVPPPHGYFGPSNLVRAPDGFFYTLIFAITSRTDASQRGTCLLRSDDPARPDRWRFWDGHGFDLAPRNPYELPEGTDATACTFVSPREIGGLSGSLTWNSYLQGWLLVGADVFDRNGTPTCGIWLSTSADLIAWAKPALIKEGPLPFPPCNTRGAPYLGDIYPSIIDPDDDTMSFERSGQTPYLYFTRWVKDLDRPLMRVPIRLQR